MTILKITGNPITRKANRSGPSKAEKAWQQSIANQTIGIPAVTTRCKATIKFRIVNWNASHGPDIDNLLKPLLDGLKTTVLPKPTEDSVIYEAKVSKVQVQANPGVDVYLY